MHPPQMCDQHSLFLFGPFRLWVCLSPFVATFSFFVATFYSKFGELFELFW